MLLAIETSCDETAAAVVQPDLEVCSSVVATQIPVHARYGGVVPELASRSHLTAVGPVVRSAIEQSGCSLDQIEAIGVTAGPGLAGCLLVGLQAAKALAWSLGVPLVPVDHIEAHIQAVFLKDAQGAGKIVPDYPFIALAVSGGHTSLYRVEGPRDLELLGQTLDDAAGEAFDKTAKMMGLPYPGGVHIDRLAQEGDVAAVDLPRPMLNRGLDFSFSGLKTAVRYHIEGEARDGITVPAPSDLAASLQEAIVDVLCTKAIRAARAHDIKEIVVAGGVASNSRLRAKIVSEAAPHGIRAHLVPGRYCTDNAAMIGGLAVQLLERGGGLTGDALTSADIHVTRRPARQPRVR